MAVVQLTTLTFDIDSPIKFKENKLEFKSISLFIGVNSSGKSFIMKCAWALTQVSNVINMTRNKGIESVPVIAAQSIFDNTFVDQDINGTIVGTYTPDIELTIKFEKGKVMGVTHTGLMDIEKIIPIRFMSSDMRTFDDMARYLSMRNMLPQNSEISVEMCKHYRLYDVAAVEAFMMKCPIAITSQTKESMKTMGITHDFNTLGLDMQKPDFYMVMADGSRKYLTTLGKGEQAIINMYCTLQKD